MKDTIKRPFFCVNPKSYIYGEESMALARRADMLAEKYDIDLLFTAQHIDLMAIARETKHLLITAQHMDGITAGRGMGRVLPEGLKNAGVGAVVLNHIEHQLTISQLASAIARAKELGIKTIVCADSAAESRAIATFGPDMMICEPTGLIGTGKTSDMDYVHATNEAVKSVSPHTFVIQAAGISKGSDVYDVIMAGADGSGSTSGIVAAPDRFAALDDMVLGAVRARDELIKKGEISK